MIVVGAKETKHLFLYLFEKDTSMMWALGSVPLVSVFLQAFIYFLYVYIEHYDYCKAMPFSLIMYLTDGLQ